MQGNLLSRSLFTRLILHERSGNICVHLRECVELGFAMLYPTYELLQNRARDPAPTGEARPVG